MRALFKVFIFIFCLPAYTKAQTWVTIPDNQFTMWLQTNAPSAMNGNQMDIASPAVTTMTVMNINGWFQIADLTGIQYFTSLARLETMNGLPLLSYIPAFPNSLQTLILINCPKLKSIPSLPGGLTGLTVSYDSLINLPALPSSLISLNYSWNYITAPLVLPASLQHLSCDYNQITSLPAVLPPGLNSLRCIGNRLTQLPPLPAGLQNLDCSNNHLTSLPPLPDSIKSMYCQNNDIHCFPTFPNSIKKFFFNISNNPFVCLPNYIDAMDSATRSYPLCEYGNPNGCEPTVPSVVVIPNIFTPNGDNINDEFFINSTDIADLSCQIYNRWGELVYQLTGATKGWDGKEKSGAAATEGVYYYLVSYIDYKKDTIHKNGFLELLR